MSEADIPVIRGIFNQSTMFEIFGLEDIQHDNIVVLDAPSLLRIMDLGALWGHSAAPKGDVNPSEKIPAFLESIFDYPHDVERYVRHEYEDANVEYPETVVATNAPCVGYDAANVGGLMILSCIWAIVDDMGVTKPDKSQRPRLVEHIYNDPGAASLFIQGQFDYMTDMAQKALRL